MEFTLPIFLKFFPNMLPSTFKEADQEVNSTTFDFFDENEFFSLRFALKIFSKKN